MKRVFTGVLGLALMAACTTEEQTALPESSTQQEQPAHSEDPSDPVDLYHSDASFYVGNSIFKQSSSIYRALGLEPRSSDGMLCFSFETESTSIVCRSNKIMLEAPESNFTVTTETTSSGTTQIPFHWELPVMVGNPVSSIIQEFSEIYIYGQIGFSITLDPDFPFTEAQISNAVITLPDWVKGSYNNGVSADHQMVWPFNKTIIPGQVNSHKIDCTNESYRLKENEGIIEPDHQLQLDGKLVVDGILTVDEKNRRHPEDASSPWAAKFYLCWPQSTCRVLEFIGRVAFSQQMPDLNESFFSEIPYIMRDQSSVFDLDDFCGKIIVNTRIPRELSVSGEIVGDDRVYPFGEYYNASPFMIPAADPIYESDMDYIIGYVSEKGGRKDPYYLSVDIPIEGFSGFLAKNQKSFSLKNLHIATTGEEEGYFRLDKDYKLSVQAVFDSPFLLGKDFSYGFNLIFISIPATLPSMTQLVGHCTLENTLPFDCEIRPCIHLPNVGMYYFQDEPVVIPAGRRDAPQLVDYPFSWTVEEDFLQKYFYSQTWQRSVGFEVKAHTAEGREGECLYGDQHLSVKDISAEVYL